MKDSTQRPSPSSPHLQAETHLEAGEGLDETACSASYFKGVTIINDDNIYERCDNFPEWVGKTTSEVIVEIDKGLDGIAERAGISLHS